MPHTKHPLPIESTAPGILQKAFVFCLQGVYLGLVIGFVVGLFRLLELAAGRELNLLLAQWKQYPWIIAVCFAAMVPVAWVLGRLVHLAPDISGSGIPQVELTLHEGYPLQWNRILWTKFVGAWLAIGAGLSLGREGPCIQMGAAVGAGLNALWGHQVRQQNPLIIAGAAAGLGAAFGAPLAGCIFVYEEMRCRVRWGSVLVMLVAVAIAQLCIAQGFGLGRILPFEDLQAPPVSMYGLLTLFALVLGLGGIAYTRCLLALKDADALKNFLPPNFHILPALLLAAGLMFTFPHLLGGGDALILTLGSLGTGSSLQLGFGNAVNSLALALGLVFLLKFAFSLYSYIGGVPGGLLMPMLCAGALLGASCGQWLAEMQWISPQMARSFILLGMVGYFAAIVRAPLTGIFLTLEMTGAWDFLPACLLVGYTAALVATASNTAPVYDSLKMRVKQAYARRALHR